jgi:hypothetical protein
MVSLSSSKTPIALLFDWPGFDRQSSGALMQSLADVQFRGKRICLTTLPVTTQ